MSENSRYPSGQQKYCTTVGRLLPQIVAQILNDLGFVVNNKEDQSNGVDLEVFDKENKQVFVAEIINWSCFSEMSNKRKSWIITNLSKYNCKRVFIYTVLKNERTLADFSTLGISLLKIGYQVLPKSYYEHFAGKGQLVLRRFDSEETRKDVESKIAKSLSSLNIVHFEKTLSTEITVTDSVTRIPRR